MGVHPEDRRRRGLSLWKARGPGRVARRQRVGAPAVRRNLVAPQRSRALDDRARIRYRRLDRTRSQMARHPKPHPRRHGEPRLRPAGGRPGLPQRELVRDILPGEAAILSRGCGHLHHAAPNHLCPPHRPGPSAAEDPRGPSVRRKAGPEPRARGDLRRPEAGRRARRGLLRWRAPGAHVTEQRRRHWQRRNPARARRRSAHHLDLRLAAPRGRRRAAQAVVLVGVAAQTGDVPVRAECGVTPSRSGRASRPCRRCRAPRPRLR